MNRPIQLEDFAALASAAAPAVQSASFNADGRWLAYLRPRDGTDLLDLHLFDRTTGGSRVALEGREREAPLSLDEELARERARQRYSGVTHARWLRDGRTLLSLQGDRIVLVDAETLVQRVFEQGAYIASAELSPDGGTLAFASGQQLWAVPMEGWPTAPAWPLTTDGSETLGHGVPDQISAEEVFNGAAWCWSPDSRQLLLASYDTSAVAAVAITDGTQRHVETARYSLPGSPVASFAVALLEVQSQVRRVVLAADPAWPYFLGFTGRGDDEVVLQRLNRSQTTLQLLRIDWRAGTVTTLLEQTRQPWINALGKPMFRTGDGSFFLLHEREGVARIGLHDRDGRWQLDIGAEAGHVDSLVGPDESGEGLYYIATGPDPRERHLFHAASGQGWASSQLSGEAGCHAVTLAPGGRGRLHTLDVLDRAPIVRLQHADGSLEHEFPAAAPPAYEAGMVLPRLVDVFAADGQTRLHAAVYDPVAVAGRRPVVLLVYGGPHVQVVRRSRGLTLDLRAQWLAQRGYLVFKVDNRGTSGRGIVFEQPLAGRLGQIEVADQCAALLQLLEAHPQADPARVAVCGWSYGGYMALRCLQLRPELFAAAIAGAPVVRWEDYDAPYTERYMGSPVVTPDFPQANAEGYREGRAAPRPDGRRTRLLLIHGMNDENVLLRHSATLMDELAQQQLPYEALLLPGERHGVRSAVQRLNLEARILEFLERTLGGA